MRAITQKSFGGPEVLEVEVRSSPPQAPGDVLVKVHAGGVNPVDAAVRAGFFPLLGQPPFTLGWDVSGVVEKAVANGRFAVGVSVFGLSRFPGQAAAYAEEAAVPEDELVRKPDSLDHVHAAALPLAGLTAWQALVGIGNVKEGDRVLIHAGAGGVGHLAIQIAKARGAYVFTTVSRDKIGFVRSLGADEAIDYHEADFVTVARDIDFVLDTVAGDYGERSLKTLKPGGIVVSLRDGRNQALIAKAKESGVHFQGMSVVPDRKGLEELVRLIEADKLAVHVAKAFPLDQAAEAHRFLGTAPKGKIVLTV